MQKMNGKLLKTVVIGDVHGRTLWRNVVGLEKDADVVIFLGDYFDSRDRIAGPKQLENFKEIIKYQAEMDVQQTTKVILLFGNHDYHYMPWHTREPYSGYLPYMAAKYRRVLMAHLDKMTLAYAQDDLLFSHAGVSIEWLKRFSLKSYTDTPWQTYSAAALAQEVNATFASLPKRFDFNGFNPTGDDSQQSPIWIRPQALKEANEGQLHPDIIQVFGHTVVKWPDTVVHAFDPPNSQRYFHADLLGSGYYLVYHDGQFAVKSIIKPKTSGTPMSELFPKTEYHKRVEFENKRAWSENMPVRKREFVHPALKNTNKKKE